jgi:hypothetical protein
MKVLTPIMGEKLLGRPKRTWEKSCKMQQQLSVTANVFHQSCTHRYRGTDTYWSSRSHSLHSSSLTQAIGQLQEVWTVHIEAARTASHLTSFQGVCHWSVTALLSRFNVPRTNQTTRTLILRFGHTGNGEALFLKCVMYFNRRQAYKSVWEIYSRPLHGLHTDILRHLLFFQTFQSVWWG